MSKHETLYRQAGDRIIRRDSNDRDEWQLTSTAPMRFNRLALMRP